MKNLFIILILFSIVNNLFALSIEEVKKKADEEGGTSLSFSECNLIGSKFSNVDSNGKPHADKGFHCAYVSNTFSNKEAYSIKNKYKDFNGSLEDLCHKIEKEYNKGRSFPGSFNNETLSCDTNSDKGQIEYDEMKPILTKQHYKIIKERDISNKNKQVINDNKKQEEISKWEKRKGNTNPLRFGEDYMCEINIPSLSMFDSTPLSLGEYSMEFGGISYNFIEMYNNYYLYRGLDQKNNKIVKVKVLKESGINGRNINIEADDVGYYCK